ncbi:MAG: hypothetical protein QGF59_33020, partial [Pirellulaceae bacterium]|nr:hypothetical protein [Pirellulaceae bacterium]
MIIIEVRESGASQEQHMHEAGNDRGRLGRRDALKLAMATAIGSGSIGRVYADDKRPVAKRDRYGGWTGKRFKTTGFFRVEKDERWWLVTPEGNAFLSFGINHLYPDLWKQAYNREAWKKKLGLENLNSPQFAPALRAWFLKTCREFGFNTAGVHNRLQVINTPAPQLPYMLPIRFVDIPHWKPIVPDAFFIDVFAKEFETHCDALAKRFAAPARNDPFLLGYAMTDCPLFTEEDCRERPDVIGGARR